MKANLFEVENTDADIPISGGIRKPTRMIALTLYDGKDTPIMVRGTHREAALQCEKIIREYRLVDGHVGVKGEGSCFNDLHAARNLMVYLANVMVEVYDEPNVEADYAKLDVYAIAKYPRRPTNA